MNIIQLSERHPLLGYVHIDDAGVPLRVGMAVRIGGTTPPWERFQHREGGLASLGPEFITVRVPGLGEYRTTGYNLWVRP